MAHCMPCSPINGPNAGGKKHPPLPKKPLPKSPGAKSNPSRGSK
jgi:hypothetical protein